MGDEVWVLGATGRSGRVIASQLAGAQVPLVLVGRDPARLEQAREQTCGDQPGSVRTLATGSIALMAAEVQRQRPAVVVNTVGPFARTAVPLARACLAGSCYVDLANDVTAVSGLLGLREKAVAAGRTFITGAGFGVLATESVVVRLCQARPDARGYGSTRCPRWRSRPGRSGRRWPRPSWTGCPKADAATSTAGWCTPGSPGTSRT